MYFDLSSVSLHRISHSNAPFAPHESSPLSNQPITSQSQTASGLAYPLGAQQQTSGSLLGSSGQPSTGTSLSEVLSSSGQQSNVSTGSGYTGADSSFGTSNTSSLGSSTGNSSVGSTAETLKQKAAETAQTVQQKAGETANQVKASAPSSTTRSDGTIDVGGAQTSADGLSTPGGVVKVSLSSLI